MPNVAEIIREHVTLDVKCVDRLYLNGYVPRLQSEGGVVAFLRQAGGQVVPSPVIFGEITTSFRLRLRAWCDRRAIPWIEFRKGERKDDIVQKYRDRFPASAGVVPRLLHLGPPRGDRGFHLANRGLPHDHPAGRAAEHSAQPLRGGGHRWGGQPAALRADHRAPPPAFPLPL